MRSRISSLVTGVQTCALPIWLADSFLEWHPWRPEFVASSARAWTVLYLFIVWCVSALRQRRRSPSSSYPFPFLREKRNLSVALFAGCRDAVGRLVDTVFPVIVAAFTGSHHRGSGTGSCSSSAA